MRHGVLLSLWQAMANEGGPSRLLGIWRILAVVRHRTVWLASIGVPSSSRASECQTFAAKCGYKLLDSHSPLTCCPKFVHGPISLCVPFRKTSRPKFAAIQHTIVSISPQTNAMRVSQLWACLLALHATAISATALTYKMQPNEKSCFFTWVDQKGAKIAFYFAVR